MNDEDYFYEGAGRGDLLDDLIRHAHESTTSVLEGEPGSGVSTLLGMVAMTLVDDYELIRLDGADDLAANAVVDAMLVHFDIDRTDLADTLKQTLSHHPLVIVVDNTDQVSAAALGTMASLKGKLGQRLTYVFGGRPGAGAALAEAGLITAEPLLLQPLDSDDVALFAEEVFGLSLDDEAAATLSEQSRGRPGLLVPLLEARQGKAGGGERKPLPWRHGLAMAALLLVVLVLWMAAGDDGEDGEQRNEAVALDLPERPSEPVEETDQESQPETASDNDNGGDGDDDGERTRRALAEYHDSAQDFENADTVREVPEEPSAREEEPSAQEEEPSAEQEPSAQEEEPSAPQPEPEAPESEPPSEQAAPDAESSDYRREQWLAARDDGEWFLQLVATGREEGARALVDRLDGDGAYYRAARGEGQAYLVLAGPYESRQKALDARDDLPEDLRETGPFPRDAAAIKKELQ